MSDLDDFLAECDDVIDDWNGSADSASWSGDGSHEHDTDGDYYLNRPRPVLMPRGPSRIFIAPVSDEAPDWTEVSHLIRNIGRRIAEIRPALARVSDALHGVEAQRMYLDEWAAAEPEPATDDARQPVPRRRGVDAQHSPYGPQRRSHR